MKKPFFYLFLGILGGLMLLLSSCHSEYVTMSYDPLTSAVWNEDSTHLAAVVSSRALRRPEGISRFPAGGHAKYLLETASLFLVTPDSDNLKKLADFSDPAAYIGSYRSRWNVRLAYVDSLVYFRLRPVGGWDGLLRWNARTPADSTKIYTLWEKYDTPKKVNIFSGHTQNADPDYFETLIESTRPARIGWLREQLKNVPLAELDLVINEIHPKRTERYIAEAIYMKNPCPVARRAVTEQIISRLEKDDIRKLLKKMERQADRLDGHEKTRYERGTRHTREMMELMLNQ